MKAVAPHLPNLPSPRNGGERVRVRVERIHQRIVAVALFLLFTGCQCLVPVDDTPDAGAAASRDAGADAGRDAGLLQSCAAPRDCRGTPPLVGWCATLGTGDGGYSCVDGQCVGQCAPQAGQTCEVDHAVECLMCPRGSSCIPPECGGFGYTFTFHVEQLACAGDAPLHLGDVVRETLDGGCGASVVLSSDGGEVLLGRIYLQSARGLSANLPLLGGECLVSELPTGAQRLLLDCPRCQVALGP